MIAESLLEHLLSIRRMPTHQVVAILRRKHLLCTTMRCLHCNTLMNERTKKNSMDEVAWYCINQTCPIPKSSISIRSKSFFESYNADLAQIFTIIILWSRSKKIVDIVTDYAIQKKLVIKVITDLRKKIYDYLLVNPTRLGGPGVICEIDESLFVHKVKYHTGRPPTSQVWVFGIVDTSYTPSKGFMTIVPDRSANTLLPIIKAVCLPGTIIHSDQWAAYNNIESELNLIHRSVNHSLFFVDPDTGVHTQSIESYWNKAKSKIKEMNGVSKENLPYLLAEIQWKENNKKRDLFMIIVGLLRAH